MEIPYTVKNRPDTGIYNAKLGVWLFLASEVMLFGGLFSAYVLLRVGAQPGHWPHGWLDVRFGTGQFSRSPLHDHYSHGADAFRYIALMIKEPVKRKKQALTATVGSWMG